MLLDGVGEKGPGDVNKLALPQFLTLVLNI